MDHADAQILRSTGVVDFDFLTLVEDAASVFGIDTRQHFHQRGFASTVLANQRMHFARAQLKLRLIERMNARKGLLDPFHQD